MDNEVNTTMSFHKKIKSSSSYISLVLQDATLENENIKNGDTLIVEEGRLPPKVINLQTKDSLSLTTFTQKSFCDVQFGRVFGDFVFLSRRDFFVFYCGKQNRKNQALKAFSPGLHRVYKVSRPNYYFFFFLP